MTPAGGKPGGRTNEAAGFGQCITCGSAVERVGWDDECFGCQEDWADEADEQDERDRFWEEYQALYTVGVKSDGSLA